MSLFADLATLRDAVREGSADAATGPGSAFAASTVETGDGGEVSLIRLDLTEPVGLADLEAELGPSRQLPRTPSGGAGRVLFPDTLPAEDAVGATVLAEVDGDQVVRILLRRDAFTP